MERYFRGLLTANALSHTQVQKVNDLLEKVNDDIDFLLFGTIGPGGVELIDEWMEGKSNSRLYFLRRFLVLRPRGDVFQMVGLNLHSASHL